MIKENSKIKGLSEKFAILFEQIGGLTKVQRLLICLLTFALIGGTYYYFIFMPKHEELKKVKNQYQRQIKTLATYKKMASEIIKYEKLMAKTKKEFNVAAKALPDKRELPSLLTGISNAGSNAGLAFHLFKPDKEVDKDFYKEFSISIKVVGRYHQITDFLYQITRLNRIVNINNVYVKNANRSKKLEMSCKAVTYMFVEKKEPQDKNKRKKRKK